MVDLIDAPRQAPSPELVRDAVCVVVPFFGDEADAARLLGPLSCLSLRDDDDLIVADNTSDGVFARFCTDRGIQVVRTELERGAYYARNAGAERARAPWLLFMDSDCRPAPSLIDEYMGDPISDECAVVAGGVARLSALIEDAY